MDPSNQRLKMRILILMTILISLILSCEGHKIHIPVRYRRKLKYGVKLAAGAAIFATKKAWIPVPLPIPIPIP